MKFTVSWLFRYSDSDVFPLGLSSEHAYQETMETQHIAGVRAIDFQVEPGRSGTGKQRRADTL